MNHSNVHAQCGRQPRKWFFNRVAYGISIAVLVCSNVVQAQYRNAVPGGLPPSIYFEKKDKDLGTVYTGQTKKIQFKIENTGGEVLQILGVSPSCGCTTAKMPKSSLKPGESDILELQFNTTGIIGKVEKHVSIQSNDPKASNATLTFKANVISEFEIVRYGSMVYFPNLKVGQMHKDTIELKNITKVPLTVLGVSEFSKGLVASTRRKTIAPAAVARIILNVTPENEGVANTQFVMETDSKNMPRVPVRVLYTATKEKKP
jgi:hypothetical protein